MWQKIFRMRWKTHDKSVVSAWTPLTYPSFSQIRQTILNKKIKIELEHLETYERFSSEYIECADIKSIKYLNLILDGGHYGCVGIGLESFDNKIFWTYCDNTSTIEVINEQK